MRCRWVAAAGWLWLFCGWRASKPVERLVTATTDWSASVLMTGKSVGLSASWKNILIVTFVVVEAYAALAIIVGAKSLIRRERGPSDVYIIIGTLTNLAWSLLVACTARLVIHVWLAV